MNPDRVLEILREKGPLEIQDIQHITGATRGEVNSALIRLMAQYKVQGCPGGWRALR